MSEGLWIVHRDPTQRRALARLAGADARAVLGGPADAVFERTPPARAVLLGVTGDLEPELEFAHRFAGRLSQACWLVVAAPDDAEEARRLFDTLPAEILLFPPDPIELRRQLGLALARRGADPLSARHVRDALAARFQRWFADLDLPELLRSLDPRLGAAPLLVRGEPGTGRQLLVRYVHHFASPAARPPLASLSCEGVRSGAELLARLEAARPASKSVSLGVCLEEVDRLPAHVQRELRGWIEGGPPPGALGAPGAIRLRWMATVGEDAEHSGRLDGGLAQTLGVVRVHLPALRRRAEAIPALVHATSAAWSRELQEAPRSFSAEAAQALAEYPWPGNLRELESVVHASLLASSADPLGVADLRLGPTGSRFDAELPERAPDALPPAEAAPPPPPVPGGERTAPAGPEAPAAVPPAHGSSYDGARDHDLRRLASAIAHEVRNPLVGLGLLARLDPRGLDADELSRSASLAGDSARRIERVVDRLAHVAELDEPRDAAVDVVAILDAALEAQRPEIERRRLVVLKELDQEHPLALGDEPRLRLALDALVSKAVALVSERGDLYVASRHHAGGASRAPSQRVMLRFRSLQSIAPGGELPGLSVAENALEFTLAERLVEGQEGRLSISSPDSRETLILVDLRAPAAG